MPDRKGVTLVELLVALVICALMIHATYRLFVTQTKAYTVLDQTAEVQQNVRSSMEVLLQDLRMAGCDDDDDPYKSSIVPIATPVTDHSITIGYRYYNSSSPPALVQATVTYDLNGTDLRRTVVLNGVVNPAEVIMENVRALTFSYGIDGNGDGVVEGGYVAASAVPNPLGANRIVSIRLQLTAIPSADNPDAGKEISPRTLNSIVTLRNLL